MKTATVRWATGEVTTQQVLKETPTRFKTDDVNQSWWYKDGGDRVGSRTIGRGMRKRTWEAFSRYHDTGRAFATLNG